MDVIKAFCIRFLELLLINFALSAIVTGGFVSGVLMNTAGITAFLLFFADAVFFFLQFVRSRALCAEAQDMRIYFGVNLSATAAFAAVNFILLFLLDAKRYTWLFITAKLVSTPTNYAISNRVSAVVFQLILIAVVFLAPLHRRVPSTSERIPLDRDDITQ